MNLSLIENWREAWRFASVNVAAAFAIVWGLWASLAPEMQAQVVRFVGLDPTTWLPVLAAVGVIVARVVKQPSLHQPAAKS